MQAGANGRQPLGAVAVLHHTDCGLLNFDNKAVREKIASRNPDLTEEQLSELNAKDFGELGEYVVPNPDHLHGQCLRMMVKVSMRAYART